MNRLAKAPLTAGLALIILSNAVALGGVAYNRDGIEGELQLSQRELQPPYRWYRADENSGIALRIEWSVLDETADRSPYLFNYPNFARTATWLNADKLLSLEFSPTDLKVKGVDHYRHPEEKEVFLVLEFDGPAFRRALELAREEAEHATGKDKLAREQNLERATTESSRLFVVDAGLDPRALRAKFPDIHHYAVVRGRVGVREEKNAPRGFVSALSVDSVHVPFSLRDVFESAVPGTPYGRPDPTFHYNVTMAYGKRFEPWIVAASKQ